MDETRTAPHSAATRPEEALPGDAFELVGAGWREHRPALRRPGWRQRLARLPLLPLCLLLLLVLGCLCAPWLANHDPAEFYLADRNTPPGSRFFFGTDSLGRDIYSIIWFGGRASLLIGLLSAAVTTVLGVAYGCLSGDRSSDGRCDTGQTYHQRDADIGHYQCCCFHNELIFLLFYRFNSVCVRGRTSGCSSRIPRFCRTPRR